MPPYHSPSQVATILQKSPTTVRRLTATYAEYLSTDATPEPGQARRYTVEDVALLKLISDATDQRIAPETIRANLATVALPEVAADLATLPPSQPVALPSPLSADVEGLSKALDRHTLALERFATSITAFGAALLIIALITLAVAAGWIG